MGSLGRGLAISRAYAQTRSTSNRLLSDIPLFRKTLARQYQAYRANLLLVFFVVHLLGLAENTTSMASTIWQPISPDQTRNLLRLLTPITKAVTAKASISGLQEAMETLGGVGYLENEESQSINIARIFRDANVLSIWEGTTDVMATDAVKVLKVRDSEAVLTAASAWIESAISAFEGRDTGKLFGGVAERLRGAWKNFETYVSATPADELMVNGREVMAALADIVSGVLLAVDAASDGDKVAVETCLRFAEDRLGLQREAMDWRQISELDGLIAFGESSDKKTSSLSKL